MAYVVEGMTLIPQQLQMSCWFASQMLIKWREEKDQMSYARLISPEFDAECARLRDNNNGIQNPQIIKTAERIGLKHVPPLSASPAWIEAWLKSYWTVLGQRQDPYRCYCPNKLHSRPGRHAPGL